MVFRFQEQEWRFPGPRILGILNVTPDSFFDGGARAGVEEAVRHGLALAASGADAIDIGGESTRPGAKAVSGREESARVLPVIRRLRRELAIPLSIDTTKSEVARAAMDEGVQIINDVSSGRSDPAILKLAAERKAGLILMHSRGTPADMAERARYDALLEEIGAELARDFERALAAGVETDRIVVDPGFGFAKNAEQNFELLSRLEEFKRLLARPVAVGISRKSFLGGAAGRPVEERLAASVAAHCMAVMRGADIVRAHDVAETRDALAILKAIALAAPAAPV